MNQLRLFYRKCLQEGLRAHVMHPIVVRIQVVRSSCSYMKIWMKMICHLHLQGVMLGSTCFYRLWLSSKGLHTSSQLARQNEAQTIMQAQILNWMERQAQPAMGTQVVVQSREWL